MGKKVLIISSSPRKDGNSEALCDEFMRGAEDGGNVVRKINLNDCHYSFCRGCGSCGKTHTCVMQDDVTSMLDKIMLADVLVLATPTYFYSMSGQLKVFLDRLVPIYEQLSSKEIYMIITAEDKDVSRLEPVAEAIRGFTRDCAEAKEKGVLLAAGVHIAGEVKDTPVYKEAYNMGKNI